MGNSTIKSVTYEQVKDAALFAKNVLAINLSSSTTAWPAKLFTGDTNQKGTMAKLYNTRDPEIEKSAINRDLLKNPPQPKNYDELMRICYANIYFTQGDKNMVTALQTIKKAVSYYLNSIQRGENKSYFVGTYAVGSDGETLDAEALKWIKRYLTNLKAQLEKWCKEAKKESDAKSSGGEIKTSGKKTPTGEKTKKHRKIEPTVSSVQDDNSDDMDRREPFEYVVADNAQGDNAISPISYPVAVNSKVSDLRGMVTRKFPQLDGFNFFCGSKVLSDDTPLKNLKNKCVVVTWKTREYNYTILDSSEDLSGFRTAKRHVFKGTPDSIFKDLKEKAVTKHRKRSEARNFEMYYYKKGMKLPQKTAREQAIINKIIKPEPMNDEDCIILVEKAEQELKSSGSKDRKSDTKPKYFTCYYKYSNVKFSISNGVDLGYDDTVADFKKVILRGTKYSDVEVQSNNGDRLNDTDKLREIQNMAEDSPLICKLKGEDKNKKEYKYKVTGMLTRSVWLDAKDTVEDLRKIIAEQTDTDTPDAVEISLETGTLSDDSTVLKSLGIGNKVLSVTIDSDKLDDDREDSDDDDDDKIICKTKGNKKEDEATVGTIYYRTNIDGEKVEEYNFGKNDTVEQLKRYILNSNKIKRGKAKLKPYKDKKITDDTKLKDIFEGTKKSPLEFELQIVIRYQIRENGSNDLKKAPSEIRDGVCLNVNATIGDLYKYVAEHEEVKDGAEPLTVEDVSILYSGKKIKKSMKLLSMKLPPESVIYVIISREIEILLRTAKAQRIQDGRAAENYSDEEYNDEEEDF